MIPGVQDPASSCVSQETLGSFASPALCLLISLAFLDGCMGFVQAHYMAGLEMQATRAAPTLHMLSGQPYPIP